LGVSSAQLDTPERGFSFQLDGPLDMRMDDRQRQTAARVVNETTSAELARLFWELGGERQAMRLARAIEDARRSGPFETTGQLAGLIERVAPRRGARIHPATRVFQALRMAVNDELGMLEKGLAAVLTLLKPGGRLAVITFSGRPDREEIRKRADPGLHGTGRCGYSRITPAGGPTMQVDQPQGHPPVGR
jgi:16S rRNA (cytosine1402-N4)-methyltransferase